MIEVEQRGRLNETEYLDLKQKLQTMAEFLGEDNKYVEYHIYPDMLLKLIKNESKKNSVLSLKIKNKENTSINDETEINFSEQDFPKLQKIIANITKPDQIIKGTQKRENYKLDDVEIALKWSEDWEHHFEIEYLIENESKNELALQKLNEVAKILNLKIMTNEEEKEFVDRIRASKQ